MEAMMARVRSHTLRGMIIGAVVGAIVGYFSGIGMGLELVSLLAALFVGIGGAVIGAIVGFGVITAQFMPRLEAVKLAALYGIALIVCELVLIGLYIGLLTILDPYLPQTVGDFISTVMALVSLLVLLFVATLPPMLAVMVARRSYP